MPAQPAQEREAAEIEFKRRLLQLGLLTRIAQRPTSPPRDRQAVPVAANAVSETIIRERR